MSIKIEVEDENPSIIQLKHPIAVSELTINSMINMDGYESKYTRNIQPNTNVVFRNIIRDPPAAKTQVVSDTGCIPSLMKQYESKQKKVIIPLDPDAVRADCVGSPASSKNADGLRPVAFWSNIHEHREKAYEVLGTTESVYIATNEEEEHKTATTAPLTEYYLTDKTDYNIEVDRIMKDCVIDSINHDRDHIKPHFHDEPDHDQAHLHFCMRYGYLAFFWRLLSRCCSWFTYTCGIIIYI